ncbi:MAG: hypothetical protein VX681_11145 [Myxococcota bacterium]|nr:hypothetical protein [Myxococcota bacterium]
MSTPEVESPAPASPPRAKLWQKLLPWGITLACFAYLYGRMSGGAAAQGLTVPSYLGRTFADVSWGRWLLLMAPYSFFFFLVDSAVVWRVINWFNTRVAYTDILPVRGSAYILSILNEQVGKGAMGLYLYRRHGVPGWELGSSMLFIMLCELLYLSGWATIGWSIAGDTLPEVFSAIPYFFAGILVLFGVLHAVISRPGTPDEQSFRSRPVFRAFREAHWWYYPTIALIRSPAILAAVVIYTFALRLFGVEVGFATMLGYLPVIFFGAATPGPMRSVAITLWVVLFPEQDAGKMGAFGLVQHNFFIFFNAAIGLVFLRRANRELFGQTAPE